MKSMQSMLDSVAVAISGLCAVHCLALPLLLIAFPVLGGTVLTDEMFHALLLWVILPTSLLAIGLGRIRHPDAWVIGLIGAGLLILAVGAVWAHEHAAPWVDTAMSLTGGTILAVGHLRNFRLCRRSSTAGESLS